MPPETKPSPEDNIQSSLKEAQHNTKLNLKEANLTPEEANLTGAKLIMPPKTNAKSKTVRFSLKNNTCHTYPPLEDESQDSIDSHLAEAEFAEAEFTEAEFAEAEFTEAEHNTKVNPEEASLIGANLTEVKPTTPQHEGSKIQLSNSRHSWKWCNPVRYLNEMSQDSTFSMIDISIWTRGAVLAAVQMANKDKDRAYFKPIDMIESILSIGFQNNDLAKKATNWIWKNRDHFSLSLHEKIMSISEEAMFIGIVNLIIHSVPMILHALSFLIVSFGILVLDSSALSSICRYIDKTSTKSVVFTWFVSPFFYSFLFGFMLIGAVLGLAIDLLSTLTQVALLVPKLLIFFPVLLLLNASYSNDTKNECKPWWSRKSVEDESVGYTNVFLSILIGASLVPAIAITTAFFSPAAPILTALGVLCAKISAFLSASAPIAVIAATTVATGSALAGTAITAPSVAYSAKSFSPH